MPRSNRLNILHVCHIPAGPPRFGAQARIHGLLSEISKRHTVTAVSLIDEEFDAAESLRHMQAYCDHVTLIPNPHGKEGLSKRILQVQSLVSTRSFERLRATASALQSVLNQVMSRNRFDIVNLEFPYLGHLNFRIAPSGEKPPSLIINSHEIAYDLARQFAETAPTLFRRVYAGANWRKLRREELAAYHKADGVYLCSVADEQRLLAEQPDARTAVIPNAADVTFYRPDISHPKADGRTVVYFGLLSTAPNIDGVLYFVEKIWPKIAEAHPDARFKIIGGKPPAVLQALAGPRIELTGFVPDLRPHLAEAAAIVVPLRLGGGTRLKIVEAMSMGKAIVSTALGAEGIEATPGREIFIEDTPSGFSDATSRLLAHPHLADSIGASARMLAEQRYSWAGAASALEDFYYRVLGDKH